jgi:hypothetical protein
MPNFLDDIEFTNQRVVLKTSKSGRGIDFFDINEEV